MPGPDADFAALALTGTIRRKPEPRTVPGTTQRRPEPRTVPGNTRHKPEPRTEPEPTRHGPEPGRWRKPEPRTLFRERSLSAGVIQEVEHLL